MDGIQAGGLRIKVTKWILRMYRMLQDRPVYQSKFDSKESAETAAWQQYGLEMRLGWIYADIRPEAESDIERDRR